MKVAIFGDSFASYLSNVNNTPSWCQILNNKYKTLDNYAEPASSLYFSVSEFLEHQNKYDKVIVLITAPGRLTLPDNSTFVDSYANPIRHVTAESAIRVATAYRNGWTYPEPTMQMFKIAAEYFTHIQNDNYDEYTHTLMVNHIKSVRPNALFIDCFKTIFPITQLENKHYGVGDNIADYLDVRNCHLTARNNMVLAHAVQSWLDTGVFSYTTDMYVEPTEPFDYYFKKQDEEY